jgi:hypothetical protein
MLRKNIQETGEERQMMKAEQEDTSLRGRRVATRILLNEKI